MKEFRYFYAPEALTESMLPAEEASHALRVLRLREGDELHVTDGRGHLIEATISEAHKDVCRFNINKVEDNLNHLRSILIQRGYTGIMSMRRTFMLIDEPNTSDITLYEYENEEGSLVRVFLHKDS